MSSTITKYPLERMRPTAQGNPQSRPAWLDDDWESTEPVVAPYDSPSSLSSRVESAKVVVYYTVYSLPKPDTETSIAKPRGKAFLAVSQKLFVGDVAGRHPRPKIVTDTEVGRVLGLPAPFLGGGSVRAFPLAELLSKSAKDDREAAIDLVIDYFDDRLIADQAGDCDDALDAIGADVVDRVPPSVLVSILGITLRAKPLLKRRAAFFDRALASIGRKKGRRYATNLLDKYR